MSKYLPLYNKTTGQLFLEKRPKEIQGLPIIKKTKKGKVVLRREAPDFVSEEEQENNPYFSIITFNKDNKMVAKTIVRPFQNALKTFRKIINLKSGYEQNIMNIGRQAKLGHDLLLFMFSKPIVKVKDVEKELHVAYNTAGSLIKRFCEIGILQEVTGYSRNRLFILEKYLDLFRK